MSTIRVAWGSAAGPTATSSFDAALAEANVHDYNLVTLSSVIPADAALEAVETAPDLGPTGEALPAVLARETLPPGADGAAAAGLGWARSDSGRGIFYESSGTDPDDVGAAVRTGLEHGAALRERSFDDDPTVVVESRPAAADEYVTAVALAAYGESRSLFE